MRKSFEKRAKSCRYGARDANSEGLGFAFINQRAKAGGEAGTLSPFAKANGARCQVFAGSGVQRFLRPLDQVGSSTWNSRDQPGPAAAWEDKTQRQRVQQPGLLLCFSGWAMRCPAMLLSPCWSDHILAWSCLEGHGAWPSTEQRALHTPSAAQQGGISGDLLAPWAVVILLMRIREPASNSHSFQ